VLVLQSGRWARRTASILHLGLEHIICGDGSVVAVARSARAFEYVIQSPDLIRVASIHYEILACNAQLLHSRPP
jgi:hypothetical protein